MEETLVWHGVASRITDGHEGDHSCGVVGWIVVLAGYFERHTGRVQTELGKEDENDILVAVISTAGDAVVNLDAEEGGKRGGDVVDHMFNYLFTSHVDGGNTLTCNGDVAVVSKHGVVVVHAMIGDEGFV